MATCPYFSIYDSSFQAFSLVTGIYQNDILDILDNGARKIRLIHQQYGFDEHCQSCSHLSTCHTGCPVVKYQNQTGRSYTCGLQKNIYADNPYSYPADKAPYAEHYAQAMHPSLSFANAARLPEKQFVLPNDFAQDKNMLSSLITEDEVLQELFSDNAFIIVFGDEPISLTSQLFKQQRTLYTLLPEDCVTLHMRRDLLNSNCPELLRNTLYIQLLRDTPVVYGDEQRTKQEHIFTYQLYANCLESSAFYGADFIQFDLSELFRLHGAYFQRGVLNNLFVTTFFLREYHYQKQKNNAFYHIQTANLPFQNFEFHYLP